MVKTVAASMLSCAALSFSSALATTITYVKYPSGYVVATDSQRENVNEAGSSPRTVYNCKLRHTRSVITATAVDWGWGDAAINGKPVLDIRGESELLLKGNRRSAQSKSQAMAFYVSSESFKGILRYEVSQAKQKGWKFVPYGNWIFVDSGTAWAGSYKLEGTLQVTNKRIISGAIGVAELAKSYIGLHTVGGVAKDKEQATAIAKRAVEIEVQAHKEVVGGPISMATLHGSGFQWSDRGACDDAITSGD